jgi:ATP-dependent protease ClpP protease subunit
MMQKNMKSQRSKRPRSKRPNLPRADREPQNSDSDSDDEPRQSFPDIQSLLRTEKKKVFRENNHIYFRCEVTMERVNRLCNLIEEYNREHDICVADCTTQLVLPLPIYLHITSSGGDLLGGLMAYDYIKNSKIPIYTVAEGYTVSSGANMFMAGRRRFMTEHSYILVHQLNQTNYGRETFHDIVDNTTNVVEFMSRLYQIYLNGVRYSADHMVIESDRLTKQTLENHMLHDIYWNYETCYRYGLVDGLYRNYNDVASVDIAQMICKQVDQPQEPARYQASDLVPSDHIIAKIQTSMKKVNVVDCIKEYLASKGELAVPSAHDNAPKARNKKQSKGQGKEQGKDKAKAKKPHKRPKTTQ